MTNLDWRQEYQSGRYRQAAAIIEQLGDFDNLDSLVALGCLYLYGMHLFDTEAEYMEFTSTASGAEQSAVWKAQESSRLRGETLLARAAELGSKAAAQNLANYHLINGSNLPEEDRRLKADYYFKLGESLGEP
ncbi:hypothetical protein [Gemmata sp.]|uniref:hypothetical protein n=1 Tax=Gemmata sp. TaxID=1914242 RepID=UPI003F72A503